MTPLEVRCFCSRRPLLALCGRDDHGEPFVHQKVYKQGKVFGEMVATGGTVRLRCRECLRWVRINLPGVEVNHEELPKSITLPS